MNLERTDRRQLLESNSSLRVNHPPPPSSQPVTRQISAKPRVCTLRKLVEKRLYQSSRRDETFHSTPSPIVRTVPFLFSFSSLLLPPNTFRGSDPAKRILSKRRRSSETFRNRPSGTVDSTWKSLSRIFVNNFRASISKVLIADRER